MVGHLLFAQPGISDEHGLKRMDTLVTISEETTLPVSMILSFLKGVQNT